MKKEVKDILYLRLPLSLKERLARQATQSNSTMTDIIIAALNEYLPKIEKKEREN